MLIISMNFSRIFLAVVTHETLFSMVFNFQKSHIYFQYKHLNIPFGLFDPFFMVVLEEKGEN